METSERRMAMLKLLCRRRHEKIANLAQEFGVSERTVRRDIEVLSLSEPIYTQAGRYGGGVYVMDDYFMDRMYFKDSEAAVLNKLLEREESGVGRMLSLSEISVLKNLIADYTKPSPANKKEMRKVI